MPLAGKKMSAVHTWPELLPGPFQTKPTWENKSYRLDIGAIFFGLAYEWDIVTDTIDWYGSIYEKLGYPKTDFPATLPAWYAMIHPDERIYVENRLYYHLKTKEPYWADYRVRRKNGGYVYVLDTGTALRNDSDTPYKFAGVIHLSHQNFSA